MNCREVRTQSDGHRSHQTSRTRNRAYHDDVCFVSLFPRNDRHHHDRPSLVADNGVTLAFKDVSVTLNQKEILSDVCGLAKDGQMLAIMGPSG